MALTPTCEVNMSMTREIAIFVAKKCKGIVAVNLEVVKLFDTESLSYRMAHKKLMLSVKAMQKANMRVHKLESALGIPPAEMTDLRRL